MRRMTDAPQSSGSPASGSKGGGWFSDLPEWARWAIPVMLVFLGIGLIALTLGAMVWVFRRYGRR